MRTFALSLFTQRLLARMLALCLGLVLGWDAAALWTVLLAGELPVLAQISPRVKDLPGKQSAGY